MQCYIWTHRVISLSRDGHPSKIATSKQPPHTTSLMLIFAIQPGLAIYVRPTFPRNADSSVATTEARILRVMQNSETSSAITSLTCEDINF
jgi:hypothetical protein